MQKSSLIVSLLFLIFLSACGKNRTIKIIAKDAISGSSYEGLSYQIVSSRTAADGEKYRTEASGTLDSNGEAIEEVKQKKGRTYSVFVQAPANTCFNKQITQFFDTQYDQNGTFIFEFGACAYLKHKFNNLNCFNEFDTLKLKIYNFENNYTDNKFQYFKGCQSFDSDSFSEVPYGEVRYYWEVVRNGVTTFFYDTIYLAPGEYKTYEINY